MGIGGPGSVVLGEGAVKVHIREFDGTVVELEPDRAEDGKEWVVDQEEEGAA